MKFAIVDVRSEKILVTSDSFDILKELKDKWFRTLWQNCYKIIQVK